MSSGDGYMGGAFQLRRAYSGNISDLNGNNIASHTSNASIAKLAVFNFLFNPLEYNGTILREAKDAYKTNELGFFIGLCFVGVFGWSLMSYRRNSLIVQKKRFIFQRY